MSNLNSPIDVEALLAHGGWVQSLARSLVMDATAADDVEQQAWLTALEHPPKHSGNLHSWWTSVVRSVAGKSWREQQRRRQLERELAAAEDKKATEAADELAARMETFRRLATAVANLPNPYGPAIYLRFFEGLRVREVAERQGVPVDTAQTHINRGLARLRSELEGGFGDQWRHRCAALTLPLAGAPWVTGAAAAKSALPPISAWLAAAAASITAWIFWPDSDPDPADLEPAVVEANAPVEMEASQTHAENKNPVNQEPSAQPSRTPVEFSEEVEPGFLPWAEDGPLISVFARDGKPVPFAEVVAIDLSKTPLSESRIAESFAEGIDLFITMIGDRYRANEKGKVRISKPNGALVLCGRTPEHLGYLKAAQITKAAQAGDDISITIDRTPVIPVKVVDSAGKPLQGASVSLSLARTDFNSGMVGTTTNADGIAWVRFMGALPLMHANEDFTIALNLLGTDSIRQDFDERALPTEPIVIVAPPTGSIDISLAGTPAEDAGHDYFAGISNLRLLPDGRYEETPSGPSVNGVMVDGKLLFPHVALGQKIHCVVASKDFEFRNTKVVDGPKKPDERVAISIPLKPEYSFVSGRILNQEGMVAKNIHFKVDIHTRSADVDSIRRHEFHTDSEGRFRLVTDPEHDPTAERTLTVIMRKTKKKPERFAVVDISRQLPLGTTDLGDLVVKPAPILVQGRVLNPSGEPVHGARVKVEYISQTNASFIDNTQPSDTGPKAVFFGSDSKRSNWKSRDDWELTADANGEFQLASRDLYSQYRVSVEDYRHQDGVIEFVAGTTNLEVLLQPKLQVRGKFILDPGPHQRGLQPTLIFLDRETSSGGYFGWGELVNRNGEFSFSISEPGNYAVALEDQRLDTELFRYPDFKITNEGGDVVLPEADLRGKLHWIKVTVVDENDSPLKEGRIGAINAEWLRPFEFQPLYLYNTSPRFDFQLSADDRRTMSLEGVEGEQRITLPLGIPVQLNLKDHDQLPENLDVGCNLFRVNGPKPTDGRIVSNLALDSTGSATAYLPRPGRYRVKWKIKDSRDRSGTPWMIPPDNEPYTFIDVREGPETQHIELTLPPSVASMTR